MHKTTAVLAILLVVMFMFLGSCAETQQVASLKCHLDTDAGDGWLPLFNGRDLTGWKAKPNTWSVDNGLLTRRDWTDDWKWEDRANIWTENKYGDFILDMEFKLDKKANSGVFIRNLDNLQWKHRGMEIQVLDSYGKPPDKHSCGAVYDCLAPSRNMVKQPGEWNRMTIKARGRRLSVVLNGEQVIDTDLNLWTQPGRNPDGTKNKFPVAFKDLQRTGYIGLQDHGCPVWYRNIRIKKLDD